MPSPEEVRDYLDRSGDDRFLWEWPIHECAHGWFNYVVSDGTMLISQVYGNVRELMKEAQSLAAEGGWSINVMTKRSPRAYKRIWGATVVGYVLEVPRWDQ
jgi:hypothetical protein